MKVFLDTNVLVSALATRGLCSDIFRDVLAKHELLSSERVLAELERILLEKFKTPSDSVKDAVALIKETAFVFNSSRIRNISVNDQDDVEILSDALDGGAAIFVTGDKEILKIDSLEDMRILSPRGFWSLVTNQA